MTAHPSDLLAQADSDVLDRLIAIGEFSLNAGGGLAAGLTLLVWVLLSADAYIAVGNAILNGVIAQAEWQTYMRRG
jgi:hypothetical protein